MVRALASFTLSDVDPPSLGEARMSERWRALNQKTQQVGQRPSHPTNANPRSLARSGIQ